MYRPSTERRHLSNPSGGYYERVVVTFPNGNTITRFKNARNRYDCYGCSVEFDYPTNCFDHIRYDCRFYEPERRAPAKNNRRPYKLSDHYHAYRQPYPTYGDHRKFRGDQDFQQRHDNERRLEMDRYKPRLSILSRDPSTRKVSRLPSPQQREAQLAQRRSNAPPESQGRTVAGNTAVQTSPLVMNPSLSGTDISPRKDKGSLQGQYTIKPCSMELDSLEMNIPEASRERDALPMSAAWPTIPAQDPRSSPQERLHHFDHEALVQGSLAVGVVTSQVSTSGVMNSTARTFDDLSYAPSSCSSAASPVAAKKTRGCATASSSTDAIASPPNDPVLKFLQNLGCSMSQLSETLHELGVLDADDIEFLASRTQDWGFLYKQLEAKKVNPMQWLRIKKGLEDLKETAISGKSPQVVHSVQPAQVKQEPS